jgi:phage-related protein
VQDEIGSALSVARFGEKHSKAKPWKREGPGVLEIVEDHMRRLKSASEDYEARYGKRKKQ